MTALNLTRPPIPEWHERTNAYASPNECMTAMKAEINDLRAALAQSPANAAAMRFVPDSECVQSRCANATTGCRHSCDLKPAGRLHNTFVVAAPVSPEGLTPERKHKIIERARLNAGNTCDGAGVEPSQIDADAIFFDAIIAGIAADKGTA